MKRIAILTTHSADNCGAVLQAYALNRYIADCGFTCHVLNYVPAYMQDAYRLIKRPKTPRDVLLALYQARHYRKRKARKARFSQFRQAHLALSGPAITDHPALIDAANAYHTVVCGSDQIWNPCMHGFDEAFFLSFAGIKTRVVSYAASFGQDHLDAAIKPELGRRLRGIAAFSCRERAAMALIDELTGREAQFVLDPVFLLSAQEWMRMARFCDLPEAYDLLCFLSNPGRSAHAAKRRAAQRGRRAVSIGFSPRDARYGVDCRYAFGPQEFLGAISKADVILTNSFHCTAFAILMRKRFYVRMERGQAARNGRMISLLGALGLEERLYTDEDAHLLDYDKEIDYASVQIRLAHLIEESKTYLARVLA